MILFYLTHSLEDKGVHDFHKVISSKSNVTERQEFELAYFEIAVQHVCHYATVTTSNLFQLRIVTGRYNC